MPRLVLFDKNEPKQYKRGDSNVWLCQCGLSKNYPLCDGTHRKCAEDSANDSVPLFPHTGANAPISFIPIEQIQRGVSNNASDC